MLADDISPLQNNLIHSSAQARTIFITVGPHAHPAYVLGIDATTLYCD